MVCTQQQLVQRPRFSPGTSILIKSNNVTIFSEDFLYFFFEKMSIIFKFWQFWTVFQKFYNLLVVFEVWTTKISWITKYFFYQISVFLGLLFNEKINLLLFNQQKFTQLKLVLRSWKKVNKIWLKRIFGNLRNIGGLDPVNESFKTFLPQKYTFSSQKYTFSSVILGVFTCSLRQPNWWDNPILISFLIWLEALKIISFKSFQ